MFYVDGKYNRAKIFTDKLDEVTIGQIIELCNQPFADGAKIRIMPDAHKGAGCTIGFTANLGDKVVPNLVGVDIGCGMYTVKLGKLYIDLDSLDSYINKYVPSGFNSHDKVREYFRDLDALVCLDKISKGEYYDKQIGTLGGGNHFIEIDEDDEGNRYLIIHSGSRNLGKMVADYYQDMAVEDCMPTTNADEERKAIIERMKTKGMQKKISKVLKNFEEKLKKEHPLYPKDLCFLTEHHREDYLHDMRICQKYASYNRYVMSNDILANIGYKGYDSFETVHNYIGDDNIIRKGAVSAYEGEQILIPINMRDGSLLCVGKGNADWNFSAPHGAGRLMSRRQAKNELSLDKFKETMKDVYTSSVKQSTLDESPMAYKSMEDIVNNIGDTVDIVKILKPIYNFKA